MPKKAVVTVLLLALFGAALFVYFTFPRTKDEIPKSANQRPFPSSPGPNGVPTPDAVPHPTPTKPPTGPSLRVMAWASPAETVVLQDEADAFEAKTGMRAALQIDSDEESYRRDLAEALDSGQPPDVCLVSSRDFSGVEPGKCLASVTPRADDASRSVVAFLFGEKIRAVPDEFSVDMLFYNTRFFDEAGIAYPDRHWTWDIVEAISRALTSLHLKNENGTAIYSLELPADFDFWNILCTQAGHPALERARWHLTDGESRDSHVRGLDLIHEFFHDLNVTAPLVSPQAMPGQFFSAQRAALSIAPSELAATLPKFDYGMTLLPTDISRASLARVNGWAVPEASTHLAEAQELAQFLGQKPVHAGWTSVIAGATDSSSASLRQEALNQSLLPVVDLKTAPLAELLDRQINTFASATDARTSEMLYAQIQAEYQAGYAPARHPGAANRMAPKADAPQLRGL